MVRGREGGREGESEGTWRDPLVGNPFENCPLKIFTPGMVNVCAECTVWAQGLESRLGQNTWASAQQQ